MEFESYAYSHIAGALYGQALGDAWAMPAYFRPEQTWEHFDGWLETLLPAPDDHPLHAGLQAGQVTGDTHLALTLAQTIIADGQVTLEGATRAIINWYDHVNGDNAPFVAPNTRRLVAALKSGANVSLSGLDCNTNTMAMGISPVGLIHSGNPDAAIADAITVCTPTHFVDVAIAGACAVAAAVAQAMSADTTLEEIVNVAVHGAQIGRENGRPGLGASVARKIDVAVNWAVEARLSERDRLRNLYDLIGSTLSAADTVPCAFGVLAMANGDPVETAMFAAALSGKADTVGAIACALAGAWQTFDVIPLEHIETLRRANPQYNFEQIAEGLFELACQNYRAAPQNNADTLAALLNDLAAET
ncbi:MAG: ADP-ribosylglycohydrolase family protein [Anaerolineae bacterium]|nr:ADP-ribosylglycohydrolase family protein [Anaerolineae bacterium]